jgi:predicted phosphoribosyltransferase
VVAVPAGAGETCVELRGHADEVVCLSTPKDFRAVGQCYQDFSQTSDDEVHTLLDEARQPPADRH